MTMNIVAVIEIFFSFKQKKLSLLDEDTSWEKVLLTKTTLFQIFNGQNVADRREMPSTIFCCAWAQLPARWEQGWETPFYNQKSDILKQKGS